MQPICPTLLIAPADNRVSDIAVRRAFLKLQVADYPRFLVVEW
jgi:hypothetical protein